MAADPPPWAAWPPLPQDEAAVRALQAVARWPAAERQAWCTLLQATLAQARAEPLPARVHGLLALLLAHAQAGAPPGEVVPAPADAAAEALRQQQLAALLALAVI